MSLDYSLDEIVNLLQGFIPKIQAQLVAINTDKVQLAEHISLTMNLVVNKKDIKPSISILSTSDLIKDQATFKQSILIREEQSKNIYKEKKQITEAVPFSSGIHFIIDNPIWFDQPKDINLDRLRIIPILPIKSRQQSKVIKTHGYTRFFIKYQLLSKDEILIKLQEDELNNDGVEVSNLEPNQIENIKLNKITIQAQICYPGNIISFEDLPEIVISIDQNVVKQALLVAYKPMHLPLEYYLFIFPLTK